MYNTYLKIITTSLIFIFSCSTKAKEIQKWDESVEITEKETFFVENFADGFEVPWGMAFLPSDLSLIHI